MSRCFQINYCNRRGTCFIHSNDGKSAFVTAAHILQDAQAGDSVLLKTSTGWSSHEILELQTNPTQDVAAFALDNSGIDNHWQDHTPSLIIAQPVVFLGFPHGVVGSYPGTAKFSTPLARTGSFSGDMYINGASVMLLDGFNNPGFSGGPVYHRPFVTNDSPDWRGTQRSLVGVINGYRYELRSHGRVYREVGDDEQVVPDLYVKPNSGIIYVCPVSFVNELIQQLAAGIPLTSN